MIDTRPLYPASPPTSFGVVVGGGSNGQFNDATERTYQITNVSNTEGSNYKIPSGALGIVGNITASTPIMSGSAFMTVWGANETRPENTQLSYYNAVNSTGGIVSPLNSSGYLKIYAHKKTDVILDIVGFYL